MLVLEKIPYGVSIFLVKGVEVEGAVARECVDCVSYRMLVSPSTTISYSTEEAKGS